MYKQRQNVLNYLPPLATSNLKRVWSHKMLPHLDNNHNNNNNNVIVIAIIQQITNT